MAESVTIAGDLMAASLQQSIDWLGETFTITSQLASQYNASTTAATPAGTALTVKGIFDNKRIPGDGVTDVRIESKAIIIGTKDTSGQALSFVPNVGDLITSNSINSSIRQVEALRGSQGVTTFYRLTLEQS